MDPKITGQAPVYPQQYRGDDLLLNQYADQVLEGMAEIGRAYGDLSQRMFGSGEPVFTAANSVAQTQVNLDMRYKQRILNNYRGFPIDEGFIDRHFASEFKPGPLARTVNVLGQTFDAVTGSLSMMQNIAIDREMGDRSYSRSMNSMLKSVGQISFGTAAGVMAGAALTGAALPVIVGGAVGMAASYAFGKAVEFFSSW